ITRYTFRDLNARLTLSGISEREKNQALDANGSNFFVVDVPDISYASTQTSGSTLTEIRSDGYLANVGLEYGSKYVFDGVVRRDGSSLFGQDNRWNTYGRGALAWRLSEEGWWPLKQTFDEFK